MLKRIVSVACLLALLTGMMLPTAAIAQQAELTLSDEQIAQINSALDDESKDLPIGEEFRVHVDANDLSVVDGLGEDWLNILLLGTDTGNIKLNYGRTDAMMVLSLHTGTGQMKLTSLVRDMLVTIPGYKIINRINTVNAFGGPLLAMKTVNQVLGLNIEHYCSINFAGFREVVDYLGGITLTLSAGEASIVKARHSSGPQMLNGEQALSYVRIRELDNNFGRNARQRKFLTAVLEQVRKSSVDKIIGAISSGFRAIATNLTTSEMIALLPALIRNADDMATLNLPQEGAYKFSTTAWGASVIEFDTDKARGAFHEFIYGY